MKFFIPLIVIVSIFNTQTTIDYKKIKVEIEPETIEAFVTGYNTVPEQTDSTPCLASAGNICGRRDVVACPRSLPLNTSVKIREKVYVCMDRLHKKYDNRFDISCDKDFKCPYQVTGTTTVTIIRR